MKLVKTKNGKVENSDFYLFSNFADFIKNSVASKDVLHNSALLKSNNTIIERKLDIQKFVILIKKSNFNTINYGDYSIGYIVTDKGTKYSIKDDLEGQSEYWKFICSEGYIQLYSSKDKFIWSKLGGQKLDGLVVGQGFIKNNIDDFILKNYEVYSSPYVTLDNIPEDYKVIFYDKNNSKLDEKICNNSMQVKFFIENELDGYFEIYDKNNFKLYKSDILHLNFGDEYLYSAYELEVIYNGQLVDSNTNVLLQDLCESITIKNLDTQTYKNIVLTTNNPSNDLVELSLDGIKFDEKLVIDRLDSNKTVDVVIKITKNANSSGFAIRNFNLSIEVGEIIE